MRIKHQKNRKSSGRGKRKTRRVWQLEATWSRCFKVALSALLREESPEHWPSGLEMQSHLFS